VAENDWSEAELRAAVEAYIEMLNLEQSGSDFSKTAFRNRLRAGALASRTDASIEFRMRNISAVMAGLGRDHITGYRPAGNVGARIEASLTAIIADVGAAPNRVDRLDSVLKSPEELMGVKAVFGLLSSHVLCFGGRGSISDRSYFSVAAGAARRAVEQPFIITIGGGKNVRDGLEGRVLNIARASLVYGPTSTLVTDPAELSRLAQWPVAIALHDAWRFVGSPHPCHGLRISGSQDLGRGAGRDRSPRGRD
jgi:hypothetical protein